MKKILVFLTGAESQGKTTTAQELGKLYNWKVIDHKVHKDRETIDEYDKIKRYKDIDTYLAFKSKVWNYYHQVLDACDEGIYVFDVCPIMHRSFLIRHSIRISGEKSEDIENFEHRSQIMLEDMEKVIQQVITLQSYFFLYRVGRCNEFDPDGYRSTSKFVNMNLEETIEYQLIKHQAKYEVVPYMPKEETAKWIARRVE